MNCDGMRPAAHEYLRGWLEPLEVQAVQAHLDRCASCSQDLKSTQSSLALLRTLPDIESSADGWNRLERSLPSRKPAVVTRWLRAAAAASILAAAASFFMLASMTRAGALPVVAETHKALNWNDSFTAPRYTQIEIPDVGILRLNQGATIRLSDPRTCILENGDLFAEIIPSGRGFAIRSRDTVVTVHGTKFGMASSGAVYVVEGQVEVASPRGHRQLGRGQAVTEDWVEVGAEDYLRWLARYERPDVRLTLDPGDTTTITPGSPLKWTLILETDALAPLYLGKPRDLSQFLTLIINQMAVPIDGTRVSLRQGASTPNGLVRLDVSHSCVLECAIDPALFREKGRATVRAVYNSGAQAPEGAWIGTVRSAPVMVEVK